MHPITVMKRVEVTGSSEWQLERRLRLLREAIRIRSGSLVDVLRPSRQSKSKHSALVLYQLPIQATGVVCVADRPAS